MTPPKKKTITAEQQARMQANRKPPVLTREWIAAMQAGRAKKSRTPRVYSGKFRGEVKP